MRATIFLALSLHLLHLSQRALARRGGGGGFDFSGSSGGGDNDDDDESSGSGYVPPPPPPPCEQAKCICDNIGGRMNLYELPGIYYNGTLTITHQLTANSAWDAAAIDYDPNADVPRCDDNKDDQQKSYQYPALLYVGPTGNASDTNPVFWALRAYQPPDDYIGDKILNMEQKWVNLRSSDFVVTDNSLRSSYFGQYDYYATDDMRTHQETHVYWDTSVSAANSSSGGSDNNIFDISARYTTRPRNSSSLDGSNSHRHEIPTYSQYVTLSDVCAYDQERYLESGSIAHDDDSWWATWATIYPSTGATAQISNIGGDTATFSTSMTAEHALAFVGTIASTCSPGKSAAVPSFVDTLTAAIKTDEEFSAGGGWFWNVSARIQLQFEGAIVRENSTSVNSTERDGTPVFVEQYERATATPSPTAKSAGWRVEVGRWGVFGALGVVFFMV
ncbi:hypothetical protein K402DRAFT_391615 [Aulographum hederae CBS 113979]|uniref:Glycoside hydrolase family 16 protein n=1 Tax=Aulographum hederae CBS 113979 TaxID=1176131 RepID=A0A6G1H6Q4_9PEZI|nr:hypothetical protein K402DRAFT_391615 [Aulographum hederae CBS 113979]